MTRARPRDESHKTASPDPARDAMLVLLAVAAGCVDAEAALAPVKPAANPVSRR
jgi:hypothetical protein